MTSRRTQISVSEIFLPATFPLAMTVLVLVTTAIWIAIAGRGAPDVVNPAKAPNALLFAVGTGIASMVLIETAKKLFWLRAAHHRFCIVDWFTERHSEDAAAQAMVFLGGRPAGDDGPKSILRRAAFTWPSRRSSLMFNLPVDQICAQISLAAEQALDSPNQYQKFLFALLGDRTLVDTLVADAQALPSPADKAQVTESDCLFPKWFAPRSTNFRCPSSSAGCITCA